MAIVSMCGFDSPETLATIHKVGTPVPLLVPPRAGASGLAVRCSDPATNLVFRNPSTQSSVPSWVHLGFWMRVVVVGTIVKFVESVSPGSTSSTVTAGLGLSSSGNITVVKSTPTPIVATGLVNVADGAWHHIQFSILHTNATTGRAKVWVDGALDIDFTGGVNGGAAYNHLHTMILSCGASARTLDFDDVWLDFEDVERFTASPLSILLLRPNGAGASTQWSPTPSGRDNWFVAGDGDDSTFVTSQTAGARDLYAFTDLPAGATGVAAVTIHTRGQQVGGGAPLVRPLHRHPDGTVTAGAGAAQGSSVSSNVPTLMAINPATGLPWTVADVNDAQFGIELS